MNLVCAICLYVREGAAAEAITVIEGYAVCEDHLGYVARGMNFHSITGAAKRESAVGSAVGPEPESPE